LWGKKKRSKKEWRGVVGRGGGKGKNNKCEGSNKRDRVTVWLSQAGGASALAGVREADEVRRGGLADLSKPGHRIIAGHTRRRIQRR
jgi:hypothetical protein